MTSSAKNVMTKAGLVGNVSAKSGLSKKDVESVLDAILESLKDALKLGSQINLPGFGIFAISDRAARTGRNPATGATIQIKASKSVRFKMSSLLKKLLND